MPPPVVPGRPELPNAGVWRRPSLHSAAGCGRLHLAHRCVYLHHGYLHREPPGELNSRHISVDVGWLLEPGPRGAFRANAPVSAGACGHSVDEWVSERQYLQRGICFARPANASLYRAASTIPQSREPRLAAWRRKAMSYEAQAEVSKVLLAFVIVLR